MGIMLVVILFLDHYKFNCTRKLRGTESNRRFLSFSLICLFGPPASEASREVANLTERKNPHTPVYGVKEFVRLSVLNE